MSNDDELNRQYRDREDRKAANKEFNDLLEAYHSLVTFETLQPITFDPAFFAARIRAIEAIEAIGIENHLKAGTEQGENLSGELDRLRAAAPTNNAKLLEASQLLLEFQRQKKLLNTLMDTVHGALDFVLKGERNAAESLYGQIAELEAAADNPGESPGQDNL